jgi:predicted enzyme related to lactoylglutathione lyase
MAHFEVPVSSPDRAMHFYHDMFGWEVQAWEGPHDSWLITTGPDEEPGIDGGFAHRSMPVVE